MPEYRPQPPVLKVPNPMIREVYDIALKNLLEINTVPCDPERYDKTGLLDRNLGLMIRAGGNYASPWTRDAAINCWNCASLLSPRVAENTLWAVCQRDESGDLRLQMDDQGWDKIIWAVGAWNHYLLTGDREFLKRAYETIRNTLDVLEKTACNPAFGLFTGGSFFNDGISGYPPDLHEPGNGSSFVGDHPAVKGIMTLSTNCIYSRAYAIAGQMARLLGDECPLLDVRSRELAQAINRHLWNENRGSYDYFLYPDGRTFPAQEGCGICFAILFGICPEERAAELLDHLTVSPYDLASIQPPFPGLPAGQTPGRHNDLIWPFINGFYITALSRSGRPEGLKAGLLRMAQLVLRGGRSFYEIYNPYTGEPDGGWQIGRHWGSCHDQTWSATGYIRGILHGLFGLEPEEAGVRFRPCVPRLWGGCSLENIPLRQSRVTVLLTGSGSRVTSVRVNGEPREEAFLSYGETGDVLLEITLSSET